MLAFIDSPIQLVIVAVVVLLVFGPQKLPEMLNQLGRAIREFKRTTSDLSNSLNLDDRYEPHYNPPRYDSYGNASDSYSSPTVPEEDLHQLPAASPPLETPRGDFAASAFADNMADHGGPAPTRAPEPEKTYGVMASDEQATVPAVAIKPADGIVSRQG